MNYVYIIESTSSPGRYYVGSTTDVRRRVNEHNEGKSVHTAKHRPWKLATHVAFENRNKAFKFERYLKTGYGRAFAKRHFRAERRFHTTSLAAYRSARGLLGFDDAITSLLAENSATRELS